MAKEGLENIKNTVLEYADIYAKSFSDAARHEFPNGSGKLANSYRGVAKFQEGSFSIEVYGEDYGIYQDSGVDGINKKYPKNVDSFYAPGQFKEVYSISSRRISPVGGDLPIGQRFVIRYNGLKPRPFLKGAADAVTPDFRSALEEAGVKDIDSFMTQLTKIEVK